MEVLARDHTDTMINRQMTCTGDFCKVRKIRGQHLAEYTAPSQLYQLL